MQYIRAEKHIHLNREESPCTNYEEIGTTFVDCVSKKIMDQSGCKVKWNLQFGEWTHENIWFCFQLDGYNSETSQGFPECANMEKIAEHLKFWFTLIGGSLDNVVRWLSKLSGMANNTLYASSCSYTGCHIPCSYMRYFAAGVHITLHFTSFLKIWPSISGASDTLWQRKQHWVHVRLLHKRRDRQGGGLHLPAAVLRVRVRWIPRPLRRLLFPNNLGLDTLASQMLHS